MERTFKIKIKLGDEELLDIEELKSAIEDIFVHVVSIEELECLNTN